MRILYIPLDERPCNRLYPQMVAGMQQQLELVVPPMELLNKKKTPADLDRLWAWIEQQVPSCQSAIVSVEMLVYGGLLPSRLHHSSEEELTAVLDRLRAIKERQPALKIYASNLIMRTPHYDSSEEEPDYYAEHGERIFQWAWFTDKRNREGLSEQEQQQLAAIEVALPEEVLADYADRRKVNVAINKRVIDLVREGVVDFLSIPQDDSAPYGFTAIDQQQVVGKVIAERLQDRVHMYPGADEVGCTLLARAYGELQGRRKKVYVLFSSVMSEQLIPLYEDRPIAESLKAHILAAGAQWVQDPKEADFVLAVNTAGKVMQEAWDNPIKDITYSSFRNLRAFVDQIRTFLAQGMPVAVADVAFANGGETELVQMLDDACLWDNLLAYAGWNTNCNTTGTVLATAIVGTDTQDAERIAYNKIYHLLEGWAYQTVVRKQVIDQYLPAIGASYYVFGGKDAQIHAEMERRLRAAYQDMFRHSFKQWELAQVQVYTPWDRMFEIGINLEIKQL